MTERMRTRVFLIAGVVFLGLYGYAALNLPAWGAYRGPYGDVISRLVVYQRHATDAVNAINYDYRAFDTLGEEFILFTAVMGVMMLLRRQDDVATRKVKVTDETKLSTAVRAVGGPALAGTLVFGFYIALHGQLSPGGGFQGGVILATAPLLVYVCENTKAFKRVTSHSAVEVIEALGAGGYALVGLAGLAMGVPLLTNVLPIGKTGDVWSSGTIALISATVGLEVTASFLLVVFTYLEEIISGEVPQE